jgi:pyruvate/2-oxoglutarate dehydrogenase complex dihydrolipoamide dehydrogenase (E3) component
VTNGATVDQNRQTSVEGIFACGNVLHVHDLVDFVSEEAEIAGKAAAEYIFSGSTKKKAVPVKTDGQVRYTVPQAIEVPMDQVNTELFFRVGNIYKNKKLVVRDQANNVLISRKKPVMVPGEMERVKVTAEMVQNAEYLTIGLED